VAFKPTAVAAEVATLWLSFGSELNNQTAPLTVNAFNISSSAFTETDNCTASAIPAFGQCTVKFTFAPSLPGPQMAAIVANDSFPNTIQNPQSVQLFGYAVGSTPAAGSNQSPVAPTIAPSALSFNPVSVGNSSQPQNLCFAALPKSFPLNELAGQCLRSAIRAISASSGPIFSALISPVPFRHLLDVWSSFPARTNDLRSERRH